MKEKTKPKMLIAEDEKSISEILKLNFELENFEVLIATDGEAALDLFKKNNEKISIVLLDIMMPEINGFTVCSEIKKINPETPIIMLTAKGESEDRVRGLRIGADDYLTKPFDLEELILRVRKLIKRNIQDQVITFFEFERNIIDFENWTYKANSGEEGFLSKREVSLLRLLIDKRNKVVSRDEILQSLWNKNENPSARTIDNMILNFRKIFEPDPKNPIFFHSVRGVGYRFSN